MTTNNIVPINAVDHCMHVAALYWEAARHHSELEAEAERREHIGMSIKFASGAQELRIKARIAETAARGIEPRE
jgi:hypothetical protein